MANKPSGGKGREAGGRREVAAAAPETHAPLTIEHNGMKTAVQSTYGKDHTVVNNGGTFEVRKEGSKKPVATLGNDEKKAQLMVNLDREGRMPSDFAAQSGMNKMKRLHPIR